ncbi:Retrovirus-related Pol polyprotein from transposon 17.6 [Mytilus coruscus]|uniref:Retrovirus-related Pol polyprotein from transposon 17.6 n=1 Tax=Mytilus coruscus TaxID=42192 RepID=A0A6J7ZU52_MYTCO|nr:Retrovirus-related Pol polyprotein from transposon 17.6 [Mytilus coruscus]
MGKPRSVRSRKTDTHHRGHSSQYESETEDSVVNTLYTTDDETCHSGSDQVYEATHDLSNIETEEEEETIVLRPRSKLNITSASECDETDDEVFSDACSDIDTNSIDTDVITQSKRSKSKIAFSNAKLPSFTGKEKWEVWINRFEAVANLQNWDNKTKLSELLTRLQGEAGDFVFDQLNSKTLKNYTKLATELKNRFGVFENKRTYNVQFNRRTQKPNEDTADYAAELKRIYDKAYSNRHAKIRQEDLLQRFLMELSDNEARIHIELTKDPKTIEEAVQEVITYRETTSETQEDQTVEKKQNTNFNKQGSTNTEKDVISVTKDELQKMFDKMYEDKKRNDETQTSVTGHKHHDERQFDRQPFNVNAPSYVPNGNYRKKNSDRNNNPENIPKCYYCGQPGHYARKCYSNPNRQTNYRNNKATPPRQMNKPYTPPNSNSSMSQERVNTADQELALKFNENGHKLDNIGVHEPTSSITLFSNSNSKVENISNSGNNSNSNSKEENISNSRNISNSNSKEENISYSGNNSNSNSKEENISNSNSKEENISNSNRQEENISNRENIVKHGDNSNTSSVTLEDKNLVCSTPILGSEQSIANNVIARQVLPSDGVYVEGHIQGSEVNFTVDTGAVRTVLSLHAFNKIPHVNRPILEKSNTLACADGKPLKELGKAIFEIKLGNLCFSTEMIVVNIEDEALLGLDVLMKSQWGPSDIKLTDGIILLGGHAIHCTQIGQTNKLIRKIYVADNYEIPPRSEILIDVFVDRFQDDSPETVQDCILEPSENFSERFSLVMAPCLDTVIGSAEVVEHEPKMLLECEDTLEVNNQNAMRRLKFHDSNLMSGKGVSKEEIIRHLTNKENAETRNVPVHLKDMFQNIAPGHSETEKDAIADILNKYSDTFSKDENDLGRTSLIEFCIETGDAKPIKQPPRLVPMAYAGEEKKLIDQMTNQGIIQKSTSPWSSPLVLVLKKNRKVRACCDYRILNRATKPQAWPLPRIQDCLDTVAGRVIFSTFDLTSGFNQIPVRSEDIPKTAFVTKYGLYEYKTLPFGLTNGSACCQRLMELVLSGLQWQILLIYLDDIILFSSNFSQHLERLDIVLKRLQEAALKLKPEKCNIFQTEVTFLGHVVFEQGIQPNPDNITKILECPVPKTVKSVRHILGLGSYYRRFIRNFSDLVKPLTELTKKSSKFVWSENCQLAFEHLKQQFVSPGILAYPRDEGEYILDTDASDDAIGAVLAYGSRNLNKAERNYCITDKELLAVRPGPKHGNADFMSRCLNPKDCDCPLNDNMEYLSCGPCKKCTRRAQIMLSTWKPFSSDNQIEINDKETNTKTVLNAVKTRKQTNQENECTVWNMGHTHEKFKELQNKDEDVGPILRWKISGKKSCDIDLQSNSPATRHYYHFRDSLVLQDGLLFRKFEKQNKTGQYLQFLTPEKLKYEVLHSMHDAIISGHLGKRKPLKNCSKDFIGLN